MESLVLCFLRYSEGSRQISRTFSLPSKRYPYEMYSNLQVEMTRFPESQQAFTTPAVTNYNALSWPL